MHHLDHPAATLTEPGHPTDRAQPHARLTPHAPRPDGAFPHGSRS
jgi:hypothetical protein